MMTTQPFATRCETTSRLLAGCALALTWVSFGNAPAARAQSFLGTHTVTNGAADVFTSVNTTTVVVNTPTVVLDWTPNDQALSGIVQFQNQNTTATFVNGDPTITDYVVLNRILPVFSGVAILNRQVRLDGTIRSLFQAPGNNGIPRGSIWFYSPGGLIVGQNARIDVGSLVLSTSDINVQNLFAGNNGTINFTGAPTANSSITIEAGAQINALLDKSSYIAMVAPRIVQGGTVAVDGSVAYVAAEAADISINQGLFDITVQTGSGDANGVVHSGSTTGPASTPTAATPAVNDPQRIYMVAVPKNTAMTMLLGGTLGYLPAASAAQEQSAVVLSAGYDIVAGAPSAIANATTTASASIQASGTINTGGDIAISAASLSANTLLATRDTILNTTGNIVVTHTESGRNLTVTANRFETGLNSIVTGGNINVATAGDALLGNSQAGGFINVSAGGLINFNTLSSGTTTSLSATGLVSGVSATSGGTFSASSDGGLNITSVTSGESLFASVNAGNLSITTATATGDIGLQNFGTGSISATTATAGGDIFALAGGDITFTAATANGTFVNGNGQASIGNIFVLTDGDANFGTASAATMIGVRAANIISSGTLSAGEDIFLLALGSANIAGASAGDDLDINAPLGITLTAGTARATARDDRAIEFIPPISIFDAAFTIANAPVDGSDIRLTSASGSVTGANLTAGDDILINVGGAVALTGTTLTQGQGITGTGSDILIDAASTALTTNNAFNDFAVTTTGAAGLGAVVAGRLIRVEGATINGTTATAGTRLDYLSTSGGIVSAALSAGGSIEISANTSNVLASIDISGPITAGSFAEIRAGGPITMGTLAANTDAIVSTFNGSDITVDNVTAGDDLWLSIFGTNSAALLSTGTLISTGLGSDSADSAPATFGGAGPTGNVIRVRSSGSLDLDTVTSPDRVILVADQGGVLAGPVSASRGVAVLARGNIELGRVTTDRLFYVADSSMFLPFVAPTYELTALDGIAPVRTSGSLDVNGLVLADVVSTTTFGSATFNDVVGSTRLTIDSLGAITAGNLDTSSEDMILRAGTGITIENAGAEGGSIILNNINGIISTENLSASRDVTIGNAGNVVVRNVSAGDDIRITTSAGDIDADSLQTSGGPDDEVDGHNAILVTNRAISVGQARISQGDLIAIAGNAVDVSDAIVSGNIDLRSGNADVSLNVASATAIRVSALTDAVFNGAVTADTTFNITAEQQAIFNGATSGETISVRSNDIVIGASARLGTAGTTRVVSLSNLDGRQMVIGGAGVATGYSLSAAEFARVFSNDIDVTWDDFLSSASAGQSPASVGSATPPNIIIDSFNLSAGAGPPPGNIGGQGTLSFSAPKIRVIGNAVLSNAGASTIFSIDASDALEIIAGSGSLEVRDSGSGLTGALTLNSDDIIAATSAAITAVSTLTTASEITTRLNQNDGVTNAEMLRAGTINVTVRNGVYIQNTGISDRYADRRGFSAGTGGFNINSANASVKIVVNGQIASPTTGFATGLTTIPLVVINDQLSQSASEYDLLSTINGCLISGYSSCGGQENPRSYPRDSITGPRDNDNPIGVNLPAALFEFKDFEPYGYPPLIDEPVTGAGNDDLWPADCSESDTACQTPAG